MAIRLILLIALLTTHAFAQTAEQVYVFENVHVIPMSSEQVLENHSVIVKGDRITELLPSSRISVPENAIRIDGSGKYLVPGLAEMHGHIPPPTASEAYVENVLFLYVSAGITTVRGMLGFPGQLELKERVFEGEVIGPALYLAGPSFSGNSIQSPEQAEERARKQKEDGWDLLKIHPGLTRDEFDAMAATAHEVGIEFGGHVPQEVGLEHALDMGMLTIDHLDGYITYMDAANTPVTDNKLGEVVNMSKQAGVWVVPTMALWETLIGAGNYEVLPTYEELKYMPPEVKEQWNSALSRFESNAREAGESAGIHAQNRLKLLKALNDADVPVLMGTDAPQVFSVPGFSLYRELPKMKEAGLSNYDILKSGTLNVGQYFADKDDFGTIQPGQRADLILLESNPLDDIMNLKQRAGVMVRGKWLTREEIEAGLAEIEASYARN